MPKNSMTVMAEYQPVMRRVGLDAETIFTHPAVVPWRTLPDRQNCTLDVECEDGSKLRLHVKRYNAVDGARSPAEDEMRGHELLTCDKIPTATLVGFGSLADRRSFVIFADLAGYQPADKLIEAGVPFEKIRGPTADLAASLHRGGAHHRDLYLCHFMAKLDGEQVDVRLIDTARVRRLGGIFTRGRWIIKDLAQFWYSTLRLPVTDAQRHAWLRRYAEQRGLPSPEGMRAQIEAKVRRIARHDERINRVHPTRNISIPQ